MDHRGSGPVVRFRSCVGAWDNAALVDFARYALRTEVISSPVGLVPTNVSAVSDARAREGVKAGRELRARPIQPFGRGRP